MHAEVILVFQGGVAPAGLDLASVLGQAINGLNV